MDHVTEETGGKKRDEVFWRKRQHGGKIKGHAHAAHALARSFHACEQLNRREGRGTGEHGHKPAGKDQAPLCAHHTEAGVEGRCNGRVEHILGVASQDLHGHGQHPEKTPSKGSVPEKAVHGKEEKRGPRHAVKVGQVSGVDVKELGAGEHEDACGCETGQGMQPAVRGPEKHEQASQEDMQCNEEVDRGSGGQEQVQQVGGVEKRGLKSAQVGSSRKNVGIPQGQVSVPELPEAEFPPGDELGGQVGAQFRKHCVPCCKEEIPEHAQGQQEQDKR